MGRTSHGYRQQGFSLIEVLIYISIVGVLVAAASGFYALVLDSRVKNRSINEVNQQGVFMMDYIKSSIRSSEVIGVNSPTPGNSGTALVLATTGVPGNNTITYSVAANTLEIQEGSSPADILHNDLIEVSGLTFRNISDGSVNPVIQIEFTLSRVNSSGLNRYEYTQEFQSSERMLW